jgi:hypothetical protein
VDVPLPWTHGFYGTFQEKHRWLQLRDWFSPFLLIEAAGQGFSNSTEETAFEKETVLIVHPTSSKPTNHLDRSERSANQDLE